jgi:hypothetical protein
MDMPWCGDQLVSVMESALRGPQKETLLSVRASLHGASELAAFARLQMCGIDAQRITARSPDNLANRRDPVRQVIGQSVRWGAGPHTWNGKGSVSLPVDRARPLPAAIVTVFLGDVLPEVHGNPIEVSSTLRHYRSIHVICLSIAGGYGLERRTRNMRYSLYVSCFIYSRFCPHFGRIPTVYTR